MTRATVKVSGGEFLKHVLAVHKAVEAIQEDGPYGTISQIDNITFTVDGEDSSYSLKYDDDEGMLVLHVEGEVVDDER